MSNAAKTPTSPTPEEVRDWRARMGWTLDEAAERLGVDRQTVHRWEAGTRATDARLRLAMERLES